MKKCFYLLTFLLLASSFFGCKEEENSPVDVSAPAVESFNIQELSAQEKVEGVDITTGNSIGILMDNVSITIEGIGRSTGKMREELFDYFLPDTAKATHDLEVFGSFDDDDEYGEADYAASAVFNLGGDFEKILTDGLDQFLVDECGFVYDDSKKPFNISFPGDGPVIEKLDGFVTLTYEEKINLDNFVSDDNEYNGKQNFSLAIGIDVNNVSGDFSDMEEFSIEDVTGSVTVYIDANYSAGVSFESEEDDTAGYAIISIKASGKASADAQELFALYEYIEDDETDPTEEGILALFSKTPTYNVSGTMTSYSADGETVIETITIDLDYIRELLSKGSK